MTRNLKTITSGNHKVMLTEPHWAAMLEYSIPGVYGLVPKEKATWQIGRYFVRPAYDMWAYAVDAFLETAPKIEAIRANPDLNPQGKNRRAVELITPVLERLQQYETDMNTQIATLVEMAPQVLRPVKPLADGDVMGFMQDQEIRNFLRGGGGKGSKQLLTEMIKGEHPELTSAALRAPSYALTGYSKQEVDRLANAGIAAAHGEDVEVLDDLRLAFDDSRTAALRVVNALAEIIGPLEKGTPLARRLDPAFKPNENLPIFKQWLESIPRPPKRPEPMIERKDKPQAA